MAVEVSKNNCVEQVKDLISPWYVFGWVKAYQISGLFIFTSPSPYYYQQILLKVTGIRPMVPVQNNGPLEDI